MRLFSSLRLPFVAPVALAALSTLSTLALTAPKAHAQAAVVFAGGNGTPLTATLAAPVTYTLTAALNSTFPIFVFQGANLPVGLNGGFGGSGTLTYTASGVTTTTNIIAGNNTFGQVAPTDVIVYNVTPRTFSSGTVITLNAGMFTTGGNVSTPPPASGTFTTFIVNSSGVRVSGNGVSAGAAAPEPGTISLVGMGIVSGMGTLGVRARKRRRNAAL